MFQLKYLFYFILLHLIIATPQINLYHTDGVGETENDSEDNLLQHHCLRVTAFIEEGDISRQIISYCMSQLPPKVNIEKDNVFSNFTFDELSKRKITSQQLYLWSAPIDVIERYQSYLNELSSTSNNLSFEKEDIFYNCTLPRFGSMCQYEFIYYHPNHSSLYEIIHDFYHAFEYKPTNFTCYDHLKCNRGYSPACLDWSEICDGKVDCLDGEFDEEHCWQLEINQCKDDEYQCSNGQCIPQTFFRDDDNVPDCLDGSDESINIDAIITKCIAYEPSFRCEDMICQNEPLTSSCVKQRQHLLMEAMYSIKDSSVLEECWSAFKCLLSVTDLTYSSCHGSYTERIQNTCPPMLYIPNVPVLFGHVYTAYTKNHSASMGSWTIGPPYICYNNSRYDDFFNKTSKALFNGEVCFRPALGMLGAMLPNTWNDKYYVHLRRLYNTLKRFSRIVNYTSAICNKSNVYQCINSSKCISRNYMVDNIADCPYQDDEKLLETNNISDVLKQIKQNYYKCEVSGMYIPQFFIENDRCDCGAINTYFCEDEDLNYIYSRKEISFQTICDGFTELLPINIEERNETDETECEQWQCNNVYTHCDGFWNCPHGEDEIDCDLSQLFNCSSDHHICVSPHTNQFICLPIEQVNNGKLDCIGATDEPTLCLPTSELFHLFNFYCNGSYNRLCIDSWSLCNGIEDCDHGDDEQFCEKNRTLPIGYSICSTSYLSFASDVERFLCDYTINKKREPRKYFSLDEKKKSVEDQTKNIENRIFSSSSIIKMFDQSKPNCHRGLDLRVWLNNENNITINRCLCPPSYYGTKCEYENERVSLTIKFRALSDSWQTLFSIIILLIDNSNERIIHSYEQLTYLSIRDCKIKYNIYLIYSTRPKNLTKTYSIHIDIYEKVSLNYRGSLLFPIHFSFLPVHRLAFIVDIPSNNNDKIQNCLNNQCVNGKCIRYSNNFENEIFCKCEKGWSGEYCNIPSNNCRCSPDSLCIGISANNQSICVCPIHKFGSRCFLFDTICQNSTCENNGKCIPVDEYLTTNQKFVCICPQGFSGDRCEIIDNKISLSFEKDIDLSQSIFIHFIEVMNNSIPVRSTTFKTIPPTQNSMTIQWSRPFHLVFIELLSHTYYLSIVQKIYDQSRIINKTVKSSDRCPHISELFNETVVQFDLIRRIKSYQLPCQNYSSNLSCFHDEIHLCLCYDYGEKRLANCFEFHHNMTFNCLGQSVCQNDGQCFQDNSDCPRKSMCVCPSCYYGEKCHLTTSGFGLSLDAILGYHIIPNININHQPSIVKISLSLTIIFIIVGLINGILSLITFKNKTVREVGCGLYLLGSSITTLFTMIIFGFKFFILILTHMAIIRNQSFLSFQCHSLDFLLHICLNMDQWLNACVAIERAITAMKGTSFIKEKSKQAAKLVIIILVIVIIVTSIYDPIYRRLIIEDNNDDDDNGQRIWCIISYSSNLKIFDSIMNIFHFFVPFIINFISAIILITKKSHQQSNLQTHQTFKELLREQFRQHKHLFTAPLVLVILALPRLIITFTSKCMKSTNDSWLFLFGYFISLIPPMLTFIIFILPSKFYKKEFHKSVVQYQANIRRRLYRIP